MLLKFKSETEFKETEIGEIPNDWEVKQVRDLVDKNKKFSIVDGPFGTQLHMDEYTDSGIPVIRVINLTFDGNFIDNDFVFISEKKFNQLKRSEVNPDDLIIAKTGATIGKLALLPKQIPRALIASSCLKVTFDKNKAHPKYYLKFFAHPLGQESIKTRGEGGSTRDTINLTPFSEISVPCPPLPEQSRIATVLSWFDDLIENKKRHNEILEKTAMAIFKSWFVDFEPFKDGKFVESELGKIPKGWECGRLKELTKDIISGRGRYLLEATKGKFPLWGANGVLGYIDEYDLEDFTILTGRVGTLGNVFLVNDKFAISDNVLASIPKEKSFTFYIYLWMKTQIDFESLNVGSTQPLITKTALGNELTIIPSPSILQQFHSLVEPLFQKIINNQKQIMTLRKIRDTLLPLLVFGKLRVYDI